jgi:hypothetical protein
MSSLKRTCWPDATDIGGDAEELAGSKVVVDGVSMESSERFDASVHIDSWAGIDLFRRKEGSLLIPESVSRMVLVTIGHIFCTEVLCGLCEHSDVVLEILLTSLELNVGALIVDVHEGEVLIAEVREF